MLHLPRKLGPHLINLDYYKSIRTHWIVLYVNASNIAYFYSFWVGTYSKKNKKFIGNKNIITYIYRIQAYDLIMCGYFCTGFIDFMLKGKCFLDYTSLFSPNVKNDKIILKYFQQLKRWK